MAGEVTYQPNEADYVAAHRDWFVNAIRRKGFSTIASAALSAALVMAAIGFLAGDRLPALVGVFGGGLVIGPFAILACWGLSYALLPRRAGRLFRQHRALQKEVSYGWSDAGLTYRAANGSGGMPWEDLHRWAEGKHVFLFYLTDNLFHFVPRRALTDSDAEDLRNLTARLGPRASG
jgi:hypothetical protein